jgi:hypothetical protein
VHIRCSPHIASELRDRYHGVVASHGYFPGEVELALNGAAQAALHERAAAATREQFGQTKCLCVPSSKSQTSAAKTAPTAACAATIATSHRFRARNTNRLAELLIHHRPASVTDVNIQTGEDPVAVRELVLPLIEIAAPRNAARHQRLPRHADAGALRRRCNPPAQAFSS